MDKHIEQIKKQLNEPTEETFRDLERQVTVWLEKTKQMMSSFKDTSLNAFKQSILDFEKQMLSLSDGLMTTREEKVNNAAEHLEHLEKLAKYYLQKGESEAYNVLTDLKEEMNFLKVKLRLLTVELKPKKEEAYNTWNEKKQLIKEELNHLSKHIVKGKNHVVKLSNTVLNYLNNKDWEMSKVAES